MKFATSVDDFFRDRKAQGRINSPRTVETYRYFLDKLTADVDNRDPRLVGRDDIKRCLARWGNPNTQSLARTAMKQLFAYLVEEGIRDTNPVEQTVAPRKRPVNVYRLTRDEVRALLDACHTPREKRVMYLGICAGLRNQELRLLRGKHFGRPGYIWVSPDIAKGARERYVPVITDLEPIVDEIVANVTSDDWVIPSLRSLNPGRNTEHAPRMNHLSSEGLQRIVEKVAGRSGIQAHIHPHLLRHAFGDHIARHAGMREAQFMLGHASVATTQRYTGNPSLEELAEAVATMTFDLSPTGPALRPVPARTPTNSSSPNSVQVRGFGEVLVSLRRTFEPLIFGWANA